MKCILPIIFIVTMSSAFQTAWAKDEQRLFDDRRCPYAVTFPADMAPPATVMDEQSSTAAVSGPGFRLSAACIGAQNSTPLEGAALENHLTKLATANGLKDVKVTAPTAPGNNCGLIEGQAQSNEGMSKSRTKFCFGNAGYLIV